MKDDHVLPFDDPDHHHSVQRLLPWLINGTLDADELRLVESHLLNCSQCRADLALQRSWQGDLQGGVSLGSVESSWGRMRGQLVAVPQRPSHRLWNSLPASLHTLRALAPGIRFALLGQAAAIAVLVLLVVRAPAPPALFQTRGGAAAEHPGTARILVGFDAAVTLGEVRDVLQAVHGRLADGPTATGACVLEVPAGTTAQALVTLRAGHGVHLAESLGPDLPP